jgi:hypothetical protein
MTKRKLEDEHSRPRRILGRQLTDVVRCPVLDCRGELRVTDPYRQHGSIEDGTYGLTARLECDACDLRFSVRIEDIARARLRSLLANRPEPEPGARPDWNLDRWKQRVWEAGELERLVQVRPGTSPGERRQLQREEYLRRCEQASKHPDRG